MHSTLIVARMDPASSESVAQLFKEFDTTEMPQLMGTRRRELFHYRGLYFHLQDFDTPDGGASIEEKKTHPRFVKISQDLRAYIDPYDPNWKTPSDAMATRFYHWQDARHGAGQS
jgi:cyclase